MQRLPLCSVCQLFRVLKLSSPGPVPFVVHVLDMPDAPLSASAMSWKTSGVRKG
jgi:hypothetical protein